MSENSRPVLKTSQGQSSSIAVQPTTREVAVEPGADQLLDITGETCPMTFVRTRLALDRLVSGQILVVLLRGEEPRARVPETARALGHAVILQHDRPDGTTRLVLRRR